MCCSHRGTQTVLGKHVGNGVEGGRQGLQRTIASYWDHKAASQIHDATVAPPRCPELRAVADLQDLAAGCDSKRLYPRHLLWLQPVNEQKDGAPLRVQTPAIRDSPPYHPSRCDH